MLKIGDFSRLSRVSVKALRYYDEIGLLKPVQVDEFTGYRYYSAEQLTRLNRIILLKNMGLSLEETARLLEEKITVEQLVLMLEVKVSELKRQLDEGQTRLCQVEKWLKQIKEEKTMPENNVVIKKIPAQTVASVRGVIPAYGDIGILFGELFGYLGKQRVKFTGPPLALYYDPEYKEHDVDVEVAIPVASNVPPAGRIKMTELPAVEEMACLLHQGNYETFNTSYGLLMGWLTKNGYQPAGPNREVYLVGPGQGKQPSEYLTEIQLPVVKK